MSEPTKEEFEKAMEGVLDAIDKFDDIIACGKFELRPAQTNRMCERAQQLSRLATIYEAET